MTEEDRQHDRAQSATASEIVWPRIAWPTLDDVFVSTDDPASVERVIPIHVVSGSMDAGLGGLSLTDAQNSWLAATGFKASAGESRLLPDADGHIAAVVFALGDKDDQGQPCGPSEFLCGKLAKSLPAGNYELKGLSSDQSARAALAFGLGAYRFQRYQNLSAATGADKAGSETSAKGRPRLVISTQSADDITRVVEAVWFGRDLINTPASDLGPEDIAVAAELLAKRHDNTTVDVVVGEDLLARDFPMIHAVGRASDRAPRLIDLRWQPAGAVTPTRTLTLIGKGISFDTGGLDLKPAAGMALMKKDMGGSAAALTCAAQIMAANLPVRLRLLIPTAENSVSGNAFRPGDVLKSRAGKTVEVGNTDAEGRLVLADAITYADEETPDRIMVFATLTGAARVALGPDLPAFFTNDEAFADAVHRTGLALADPVWRMPLWPNYDRRLKSASADLSNISDGPFAGAITAALFLQRFVANTPSFAHFDLYGWRPSETPLGPKGGEPAAARTVFEVIRRECDGQPGKGQQTA